jgi:hypothetical protein
MPSLVEVVGVDPPAPLSAASDTSWLDYMSAFSGVVAVVLALVALWYARVQGLKAQEALAKERRTVLELEVLRELLELADGAKRLDRLFSSGLVEGRLALLPPDELPLWRSLSKLWTYGGNYDPTIPPPPDDLNLGIPDDINPHTEMELARLALHKDVIEAMERRATRL